MAMLPTCVRPPHWHAHESERRIPFADERAPANRHAEPRHPEIDDRAGRQRRRPSDDAEAKRRRREQDEVGGFGEESEDLGPRPGEPHARLEDVVGHHARTMIGRCPERVKTRAYVELLASSVRAVDSGQGASRFLPRVRNRRPRRIRRQPCVYDEIFLISARILSGSGSSPLPYRSMNRTLPSVSTMNVARTLAFHSGQ